MDKKSPRLLDLDTEKLDGLELKLFQPVLFSDKKQLEQGLAHAKTVAEKFGFTHYAFIQGYGSFTVPGKITTSKHAVHVADIPAELMSRPSHEIQDMYWNRGGPPQRFAGYETRVKQEDDILFSIGAILYFSDHHERE